MCNLFFVLYCLIYYIYFIIISESFILKQNIINRNQSLNTLCYRNIIFKTIPRSPNTFRSHKSKVFNQIRGNLYRTKAIFQFRSIGMVHLLRKHIIDNINKNIPEFNNDNPPYIFKMIKNSFMKAIVIDTPYEILIPNLEKTNYYIIIYDDTIISKLMSIINGIRKSSPITRKCFEPSFVCYSNNIYPGDYMRNLSSLPSKEELCKRITPIFKQPIYKIINSISYPLKLLYPINQIYFNLLYILKQIKSNNLDNSINKYNENNSDNTNNTN